VGQGATVLIEAPAGMGKTSLLEEARARAEMAAITVLHASGSPLEADYALGVARQFYESELRRCGDDPVPAGAAEVAAGVILDLPATGDAAPEAVVRGLYSLTAHLAEQQGPLLLTIDDAQWADEPSLRFVAYLARRVQSLPVALVVGTRPAEDGVVETVLDALRREPGTDVLEPAPLDLAGVESFLRATGNDHVEPEFGAACHEATGGSPFLLGELVRALRADRVAFTAANADRVTEVTLPTVARSVRGTLDRLGLSCQALARSVAVLGDDVQVDLAAALADLPTMEATFAAGELTRAGLLADAALLRFRHPLLAAAARATLTAPERMAAHARAATLLRDRYAGPERVALQLLHAAPAGDAGVVEEFREAARRAHTRAAPTTAATLLGRALSEPPSDDVRPELLLELGRAEAATGRSGDAAAHLREAHDLARDPVVRGHVTLALFDALGGDMQEVFALEPLVARARADVAAHDPELALRLWSVEAVCSWPPSTVVARHRQALELAGETPGEAMTMGHLVVPMIMQNHTGEEVEAVVSRVFRHVGALLEKSPMSLVITSLYLGLYWLDRMEDAIGLLDLAVDTAQRRGSAADIALAHGHRSAALRRAGRLSEAEADARISIAAGGESSWGGGGQYGVIPLVSVLNAQGRLDEADRVLTEAVPDGRIPDSPPMHFLQFERMYLRMAQGRHDDALAAWEDSVQRGEHWWGIDSVAWSIPMGSAAALHASLGDRETAVALANRALTNARRWGRPGYIGQALHARARLEEREPAVDTLQEAVALLRSSPARLELARALVALGGVMRRRGDRSASREPLREGYDLALQCDAQALAETARTELRASGVRVRREAPDGVEGLTASERRVAELAATGASNADIAQALFLTIKTVEMHLTRTYRKLGIGGRAELAQTLGSGTGSSP
jgi:DNA-binding CsgD family transcriptional regulator